MRSKWPLLRCWPLPQTLPSARLRLAVFQLLGRTASPSQQPDATCKAACKTNVPRLLTDPERCLLPSFLVHSREDLDKSDTSRIFTLFGSISRSDADPGVRSFTNGLAACHCGAVQPRCSNSSLPHPQCHLANHNHLEH